MQKIAGNSFLDQYFDDNVMSLHLKDGVHFARKKGKPGDVSVVIDEDAIAYKDFLDDMITQILKEVSKRDDSFVEIERKLLNVIQLGVYRIVIVYPPLSDGLEVTIVKPTNILSLDDYQMDSSLRHHIEYEAKGILISGAPGSGKTTFAQAILEQHKDNNHITKTIESPRDLQVSDEIVQYSFSHGSHADIRDILLLSRPDFCVFDEVRNVDNFLLFKDLRLTGIGLLGVIHATRAIDGIERFLGHIELGVIPQIIDTIVYIDAGQVSEVLQLKLVVKVPHGMESRDLARPVIQVSCFEKQEVMYEIYSFGEQIVVMPLNAIEVSDSMLIIIQHALGSIKREFSHQFDFDFFLGIEGHKLILYVPNHVKHRVIGSGGSNIQSLEKSFGMSISVKLFADLPFLDVPIDQEINKKGTRMLLRFVPEMSGQEIAILLDHDIFRTRIDSIGTVHITGKKKVNMLKSGNFKIVDMKRLQ